MRSVLLLSALFLCVAFAAGAAPSVDPATLEQEIGSRRYNVAEFLNIRREAEQRGLRVWMLGGAAASFGEHVKESLPQNHNALRVDWDVNSFLLPEQDIDLVVTRADGTRESAAEVDDFLAWVKEKYPYTADGRSRWDAIGLHTDVPTRHKMALEGNPAFLEQNNDSLSLGMIELTEAPRNQSVIKDLSPKGEFLRDLAGNEFHYYASPAHFQTPRFLDGTNPPILSAIRAIEKSVRYNKFLDEKSIAEIQRIIRDWDSRTADPKSYVGRYLEGRAKRVVTHAVNLEEAFSLLDKSGLRAKLLQLPWSDPSAVESLAWWLNKKPLPSRAPVAAPGAAVRTAGDLGIDRAYHWTNDSVHRLMTWDYGGRPRIFESRDGIPGENAALGNGFYTFANDATKLRQTQGSANQLVSFIVDPAAREGIDFVYDAATRTMVWKNSQFLRVNHSPTAYPAAMTCSGLFKSFAVPAPVLPMRALIAQANSLALPSVMKSPQNSFALNVLQLKKLGHRKLAAQVQANPALMQSAKVQHILNRNYGPIQYFFDRPATGIPTTMALFFGVPIAAWKFLAASGGEKADAPPAPLASVDGEKACQEVLGKGVRLFNVGAHPCDKFPDENLRTLTIVADKKKEKGEPIYPGELDLLRTLRTVESRACVADFADRGFVGNIFASGIAACAQVKNEEALNTADAYFELAKKKGQTPRDFSALGSIETHAEAGCFVAGMQFDLGFAGYGKEACQKFNGENQAALEALFGDLKRRGAYLNSEDIHLVSGLKTPEARTCVQDFFSAQLNASLTPALVQECSEVKNPFAQSLAKEYFAHLKGSVYQKWGPLRTATSESDANCFREGFRAGVPIEALKVCAGFPPENLPLLHAMVDQRSRGGRASWSSDFDTLAKVKTEALRACLAKRFADEAFTAVDDNALRACGSAP